MARRFAADSFRISDQDDRGIYLRVLEHVVCRFVGHEQSVLTYDAIEVTEVFDPDADEWYTFGKDVERHYIGCMRCLVEVELELPPPVPVDIVDWR
jgi:hypothetical protein